MKADLRIFIKDCRLGCAKVSDCARQPDRKSPHKVLRCLETGAD
jgi:hypothetical protein